MANKLKSKGQKTIERAPHALITPLVGYSVNDALEAGLLSDVGDDTGAFIRRSGTAKDAMYAIIHINGKMWGIPLSDKLVVDIDDTEELGDLKFYAGISNKKRNADGDEVADDEEGTYMEWSNLGRARGLNLAETVKSVETEVEETKE